MLQQIFVFPLRASQVLTNVALAEWARCKKSDFWCHRNDIDHKNYRITEVRTLNWCWFGSYADSFGLRIATLQHLHAFMRLRQLMHVVLFDSTYLAFFEQNPKTLKFTWFQFEGNIEKVMKFHGCTDYHFKDIHPRMSKVRQSTRPVLLVLISATETFPKQMIMFDNSPRYTSRTFFISATWSVNINGSMWLAHLQYGTQIEKFLVDSSLWYNVECLFYATVDAFHVTSASYRSGKLYVQNNSFICGEVNPRPVLTVAAYSLSNTYCSLTAPRDTAQCTGYEAKQNYTKQMSKKRTQETKERISCCSASRILNLHSAVQHTIATSLTMNQWFSTCSTWTTNDLPEIFSGLQRVP